jgi:radical SAM protein with 4Fe4S-binding SPASM domain
MNFLRPEWADGVVEGQTGKPKGRLVPEISGLPKEIALDLPRQMFEEGIPSTEITGSGEPTLYPYIIPMFNEFTKYNIETALVTHGQTLKPLLDAECIQNLQWMRFSMDSCTPEVHSKVHGVVPQMFNQALKNIERVRDMYPKSILGISFIITKDNYHQIVQAAEFWKNIGVDAIRFSFEYEPTGTAKLTPDQIDFSRTAIKQAKELTNNGFRVFGQVERLDAYTKPNNDFTYCGYMQFCWNIGYDAKAYPCCIMIYQKGFEMGDFRKQSLHEIIYGKEKQEYLEKFDVKKCHNCWLRDRNIAIETLLAPEKRLGHVNYV